MLITVGKVRGGVVELDAESLPEGATVTVLAAESDETFELGPADEAALLAAIEQGKRGKTVEASELLRRVRKR